jgi:hypothetical protein
MLNTRLSTDTHGCVELHKLQSRQNGLLRSRKIDGDQRLSFLQLQSEARFVLSIFHAAPCTAKARAVGAGQKRGHGEVERLEFITDSSSRTRWTGILAGLASWRILPV